MRNINKVYKYSGKCDKQYHYKSIIEAYMVSNFNGITDNSPIPPRPSVYENPIARKSLRQISEFLDVKQKTAVHKISASICCGLVFKRGEDMQN